MELDPRNTVALNNLAYLLADTASLSGEDLKYAQQAKEAAPDNADVSGTLPVGSSIAKGSIRTQHGTCSRPLQKMGRVLSQTLPSASSISPWRI